MSIIVSTKEGGAQKLDRSPFESEDYLQNLIHQNPESIPIYEIQEDKRLFVAKREFSTESGPIDALALDKDGDIYIVETKLYKNPDKRTVVAQALDYGASLWKHLVDFSEFKNVLDEEIQKKFNIAFDDKVKDFFGLDDEQLDIMLENMKSNLREGNIKFVILMDSMEDRLKDLILYVNQNSQFDIYAVQLEYYRHKEFEIMIPKIFGVEVKKNIKTYSGSARRTWSKEDFVNEARQKDNGRSHKIVLNLLEFSERYADRVAFGTGGEGIFSFKIKTPQGERTLLRVYSDGRVRSMPSLRLQGQFPEEKINEIIENFRKIDKAKAEIYVEKGVEYEDFNFTDIEDNGIEELKNIIIGFIKK